MFPRISEEIRTLRANTSQVVVKIFYFIRSIVDLTARWCGNPEETV